MANETKKVSTAAIRGAHSIVSGAEKRYQKALDERGPQITIGFPDTRFYFPVFYALTGIRIEKLGQVKKIIEEAKSLLGDIPDDKLYLPYLGQALDAGIATLFAQEIIEALNCLLDPLPLGGLWLGAPSDQIMQDHSSRLLSGETAGFAGFTGGAPSNKTAKEVHAELAAENFYVFLTGSNGDVSIAQQLKNEGLEFGWDNKLIPLGMNVSGQVLLLGFMARIAMQQGKINPGDSKRIMQYCKDAVFGFFMVLDQLDEQKYATAAGAISFGYLTMAQEYVQQLLPIHTMHRLR